MVYEVHNYALLERIYKEFPRFFAGTGCDGTIDCEAISKAYGPYSEIEVDEVANAICWCASALELLQERRPIKCLDEVLSFAAKVLERQN